VDVQPFVGFANPIVDGNPACPKSSAWGRFRDGPPIGNIRTDSLCPEPKTIDHVRALAIGLKVNPDFAIVSGPQLTKENVIDRLRNPVRIIAFATHGLLNTEALREAGISEPGLLLSKSTVAGVAKNQFLSMSDIELLNIDTDLVVLSACNTAADDGESGGYFSGLARAFFEAGARSILVTNWPVNSASVAQLLAGLAEHWSDVPHVPFVDMLREAMITQRKIAQHPRDWAMFTYVGR
jgi:CHAT domain-containing protein